MKFTKVDEPVTLIAITNRNKEQILPRCLSALWQSVENAPKPGTYRFYISDDDSTDHSYHLLAEFRDSHSDVTTLEQTHLRSSVSGLGHDVHKGLEVWKGIEWIVTIDSDAIVSPSFLTALARETRTEKRFGMYASNQYLVDGLGKHNSTGHFIVKSGSCLDRNHEDKPSANNKTILYPCFSGAMYSAKMIAEVGMLQSTRKGGPYEHYYGCPELGFRAQMKGWSVRFVPGAKILHTYVDQGKLTRDERAERDFSRLVTTLRFFPQKHVEEAIGLYRNETLKTSPSSEDKESYVEAAWRYSRDNHDFDGFGTFGDSEKQKIYDEFVTPN